MQTLSQAPLDLSDLLPGFLDPSKDSQSSFRAILQATAKPGSTATFSNPPKPPEGLNAAAGVFLLTLADQDTKLWLEPGLRRGAVTDWLRFHTGTAFTYTAHETTFALIGEGAEAVDLSSFHQGDAKYPDRATTVIIMVPSLDGGTALTLQGPGIETQTIIAPTGLTAAFWESRADLVSHFQFGIDLIVCADNQLISIPRTTRITL